MFPQAQHALIFLFSRLKDGILISPSAHMYVEKFPNGIQTLIIYKVTPTDAGRYQATASSPAGKATCSADVDVIEGKLKYFSP